jgi:hypothetical protein
MSKTGAKLPRRPDRGKVEVFAGFRLAHADSSMHRPKITMAKIGFSASPRLRSSQSQSSGEGQCEYKYPDQPKWVLAMPLTDV